MIFKAFHNLIIIILHNLIYITYSNIIKDYNNIFIKFFDLPSRGNIDYYMIYISQIY